MISGDTPAHLVIGARSGFLQALRARQYPWQRAAQPFNMDARSQVITDLGSAPMPTNSRGGITIQDFVERQKTLTVTDWDITVWISQNDIDDDQTATLKTKVTSAGDNFQKHINARVFTVLNAGDGLTYGPAYDGLSFFNDAHVDKGAAYQTAQDNKDNANLTLDNFNSTYAGAQVTRDDQGEFYEYTYDLLIVHPTNRVLAANICGNPEALDTANRETNPNSGIVRYITTPYLDTTAWHLIASSEAAKPLIVAMKVNPYLQSTWFDPKAPDGGRWYFKFFGRYEVHYGLWQLARQGQT